MSEPPAGKLGTIMKGEGLTGASLLRTAPCPLIHKPGPQNRSEDLVRAGSSASSIGDRTRPNTSKADQAAQ